MSTTFPTPDPLSEAPIRTPMYDPATGVMTLPWQFWFLNQQNATSGGGGGGSGVASTLVVSLTSSPETITAAAPTAEGVWLVVRIEQPGGDQILWDAAVFDPSTPVDINQDAGSVSTFTFVGISGLWTLISIVA